MHTRFRWTFLLTLTVASLLAAPLAVLATDAARQPMDLAMGEIQVRGSGSSQAEGNAIGASDSMVLYGRGFAPIMDSVNVQESNGILSSDSIATPGGFVRIRDLADHPASAFRAALDPTDVTPDTVLLVHFSGQSREEMQQILDAAHVNPLDSVPNDTVIINGADDLALATLARAGATTLLRTVPFFMSPTIGTSPVPSAAMAADPNLRLVAGVFPGLDAGALADRLTQMGATNVTIGFNNTIGFTIDVDVLRLNASDLDGAGLRYVSEAPLYTSADEDTSTSMQTGEFNSGRLPYREAGIDGSSQVIGITDTGLALDAAVLADPDGAGQALGASLSHRKVVAYVQAQALAGNVGGAGDMETCESLTGVSHGHLVASIAAGNAGPGGVPDIRIQSGFEPDLGGTITPFGIDGVAPGAKIYFVDAQATALCTKDQQIEAQNPGLLSANAAASKAFGVNNSLNLSIHNFSLSILDSEGSYDAAAQDIDQFLVMNKDFLVVTASGNRGLDGDQDGNLDFLTVTSPGTAKNVVTVGVAGEPSNALNPDDPNDSVFAGVDNMGVEIIGRFQGLGSGQGPAAKTTSFSSTADDWRIKPDLMAPGSEITQSNQRLTSPTTCLSGDSDQVGDVNCNRLLPGTFAGSSFSTAAATGAAAVIRDYFQKGFAPSGQPGGTPTPLKGPEVKAALIASADLMTGNPLFQKLGEQLRLGFYNPKHLSTFTPEQGYGRIQLNKLLPLGSDPASPSFITSELISLNIPGGTVQKTFTVRDASQQARFAIAWYDKEAAVAGPAGDGKLVRDVDLVVTDCIDNVCGDGNDIVYHGNYFTEDKNFDSVRLDIQAIFHCNGDANLPVCDPANFDPTLDCGDPNATCAITQQAESEDCNSNGKLDLSEFSLPVEGTACLGQTVDRNNNNEAVFLAPAQLTEGATIKVDLNFVATTEIGGPSSMMVGLVTTGGLVGASPPNSIRASKVQYSCADALTASVLDGAANASEASVSTGVTVVSLDQNGAPLDSETGINFVAQSPGTTFGSSPIAVVDVANVPATANDSLLSVQDGGSITLTYSDAPTADAQASAKVRCQPDIFVNNIGRRGTDAKFGISGGCEKRARIDPREIVFKAVVGTGSLIGGDTFLDASEDLVYSISFQNRQEFTLLDARATLEACAANANFDAGGCDPVPVTIIDPVQNLGDIGRGQNQTALFNIHVGDAAAFGTQDVNQVRMRFGVTAQVNGLTVANETVLFHPLNVDTWSRPNEDPNISGAFYYSTDFPKGGREVRAWAGEVTNSKSRTGVTEYRFADAEDSSFGGGNATVLAFNPATKQWDDPVTNTMPWDLDDSPQGWGTVRRFDSDPGANTELGLRNEWQWNNTGECGFQSNSAALGQVDGNGGTGGMWHSGHAASACRGGSNNGKVCSSDTDCPGGSCPGFACVMGANDTLPCSGLGDPFCGTGECVPASRTGWDLGCERYDVASDPLDPKVEQVIDDVSSPIFFRVHQNPDANGYAFQVEFLRLAANVQEDIFQAPTLIGIELDPDTTTSQPVDRLDTGWLTRDQGPEGFITDVAQGPFAAFNPNNPHLPSSEQINLVTLNDDPNSPNQNIRSIQGPGSIGPFFEPNTPGKAPVKSLDAIVTQFTGRGFGTTERRGAGGLPVRNYDFGFELFAGTFEDIFGPNETLDPAQTFPISGANPQKLANQRNSFQINVGILQRERTTRTDAGESYGWGFDDPVAEWREIHPVEDRTPCSDPSTWAETALDDNTATPPIPGGTPVGQAVACVGGTNPGTVCTKDTDCLGGGECPGFDSVGGQGILTSGCASISWDRQNIIQPETSLVLTIIDNNAAFGPDGLAGTGDEQAVINPLTSIPEIQVDVISDSDSAGETFNLVQTAFGSPVYQATVKVSATKGLTSNTDGVIFIQESGPGTNPVALTANYSDQDINVAGSGVGPIPCPDNPRSDSAFTQFFGVDVLFVTAKVTDLGPNSDNDSIPDDFETIRLDLNLVNSGLDSTQKPVDLEDVTITLLTKDPAVACITDATSFYGPMASAVAKFNPPSDPFEVVIGDTNAMGVGKTAKFSLGISGRFTDSLGIERTLTGFATPQEFVLNLDLDLDPNFPANDLFADAACEGGDNPGQACPNGAGDCPNGSCVPLPAYLQTGGTGAIAGKVGYFEGFEGAAGQTGTLAGGVLTGTSFSHLPAVNGYLDASGHGLTAGATITDGSADVPEGTSSVDGTRCPRNDPEFQGNRSQGSCRPNPLSEFHVSTTKAFHGVQSLYGGTEAAQSFSGADTYLTAALYAAFTGKVNVGVKGDATLSFFHIVSLGDDRTFVIDAGISLDRAMLQVAEVDPVNGTPVSAWQKVPAFLNNYHNLGIERFQNCSFASYDNFYDAAAALGNTPGFNSAAANSVGVTYNADDVSSEDDFFDPNDPTRQFGPNESCFPNFIWSAMGDWSATDVTLSGRAFTDGELGSVGNGVWVNSLVNLDQFSGRTVKVRFVLSAIELAGPIGFTWADFFGGIGGDGLRGWRIDDVAMSGLVDAPLKLVPDTDVAPAPGDGCPVDTDPSKPGNQGQCTLIETPVPLPDVLTPVSGTQVTLDASSFQADQCVDGFLEYRWSTPSGIVQDFSTNPVLRAAPQFTTQFTVDVRCSTNPLCQGSDSLTVVPADEVEVSGTPGSLGTGALAGPGVGAATSAVMTWTPPGIGGPFTINCLTADLNHNGFVLASLTGNGSGSVLSAALRTGGGLHNEGTASLVGSTAACTDATVALDPGEAVGYLAVATNPTSGVVGTLGRGEQPGVPGSFSRGRVVPASLPATTP
ncbi:MAG: S8 family serine peptidase [Acidobacteriota bacterium]